MELSKLREELNPLRARHDAEKGRVDEMRRLKTRQTELAHKLEAAERRRDLALVADLKFGAIPEMERTIDRLAKEIEEEKTAGGDRLVTEVVGVEQVCGLAVPLPPVCIRSVRAVCVCVCVRVPTGIGCRLRRW